MDMIDHAANNNRSYDARRHYGVGSTVTFVAPNAVGIGTFVDGEYEVDESTRLTIGEEYTGTIRSVSNAGFRGIEMTVEVEGRRYHGISMGAIV
jgi:hypothetical protein